MQLLSQGLKGQSWDLELAVGVDFLFPELTAM